MVNDWKEFLEKLKRNRALSIEKIAEAYVCGKEHHKDKMFIQVEWIEYDLQKFFLGEVARTEKELKDYKELFKDERENMCSEVISSMNTEIRIYKELAGVEQKK